jgi:hypothetical protein
MARCSDVPSCRRLATTARGALAQAPPDADARARASSAIGVAAAARVMAKPPGDLAAIGDMAQDAIALDPDQPLGWNVAANVAMTAQDGAALSAMTDRLAERVRATPGPELVESLLLLCSSAAVLTTDATAADRCVEVVDAVGSTLPEHVRAEALANALTSQVNARQRLGADTLVPLRRLVELRPDLREAALQYAVALESTDPAEAERRYLDVVARWPDDADARYNLGAFYLNRGIALRMQAENAPLGDPAYDATLAEATSALSKSRTQMVAAAASPQLPAYMRAEVLRALVNLHGQLGEDEEMARRMAELRALER